MKINSHVEKKKQMWKTLKEVIRRSPSKKSVIKELKFPYEAAEEGVDIANILNDFFSTVGDVLNANIPLANTNVQIVY